MKTKIFKNIMRSDVFEQKNDMVFYCEKNKMYKVVVCYYD